MHSGLILGICEHMMCLLHLLYLYNLFIGKKKIDEVTFWDVKPGDTSRRWIVDIDLYLNSSLGPGFSFNYEILC